MATEKRLIDAKAFHANVAERKMTEIFPDWKELPKEVQDAVCKHGNHLEFLLSIAPTVNAVEVVRCKYCNQYNGHRYCNYFAQAVLDDDFCSYGERI